MRIIVATNNTRAESLRLARSLGQAEGSDLVAPTLRHETHKVESRSHSLSEVRTDRNNAAEHAAEMAVASVPPFE